MRTSEQIDQLATALAAAQAEMKNARLNKTNPHFKSRYADLAEIRDTVTPALAKHGIAAVHGMDAAENGLAVVTRLIHKSGQWIESRFPVAYDKPQTMGSAITYGRRYNLSALSNIAADDDDDANTANDRKPAFAKPGSVHPDRAKSEPDTAGINGSAGVSKGKSKGLYETLIKEMEQAKTVEALKESLKLRRADVEALPEEWMVHFDEAYSFRRESLGSVQ